MEIPLKATFLDLDLLTVSAVIMVYAFKTTVSQCYGGYTGFKETGTCIKLFEEKKPWAEARQTCQTDGGDLYMPLNIVSNEKVWKDLVRLLLPQGVWIGMRKIDHKYQWLDEARKVDFFNWAPWQPNNRQPIICVAINYFDTPNWSDDPCNSGFYYLCEKLAKGCSSTNGYPCKQNCTGKCRTRPGLKVCDERTGDCLDDCVDGYYSPACKESCNKTYYGFNCALNCSTNCGGDEGLCDYESGNCTSGCNRGFMFEDAKCNSVCPNGTYGLNCMERCSTSCGGPDHFCENVDGECLAGCVSGFTGAKCLQEIPEEGMGAGVIFGILFLILAVLTTILLFGIKKKEGAAAAEEEAKPKPIPKEPTKSNTASKEQGSNTSGAGRSGEKEASQGSRRSGDSGGGQD